MRAFEKLLKMLSRANQEVADANADTKAAQEHARLLHQRVTRMAFEPDNHNPHELEEAVKLAEQADEMAINATERAKKASAKATRLTRAKEGRVMRGWRSIKLLKLNDGTGNKDQSASLSSDEFSTASESDSVSNEEPTLNNNDTDSGSPANSVSGPEH